MLEENEMNFDEEFKKYLQKEDNRLKAMIKLADILKNSNVQNYEEEENIDTINSKDKKI